MLPNVFRSHVCCLRRPAVYILVETQGVFDPQFARSLFWFKLLGLVVFSGITCQDIQRSAPDVCVHDGLEPTCKTELDPEGSEPYPAN
jgi:hypothetical protein